MKSVPMDLPHEQLVAIVNDGYFNNYIVDMNDVRRRIAGFRSTEFGTWNYSDDCSPNLPLGRWRRFSFLHQWTSEIPKQWEVPGNYIFISAYSEIMYIGQSKNLRQRLSCHIKCVDGEYLTPYCRPIRGKGNRFVLALRREKSRYERLVVERLLIDRLKPEFNIQHNGS